MNSINELIKNSNCKTLKGVSEEVIRNAEEELKFKFDDDYKNFLKNFGVLSCGGNEIFGLGVEGYLNVIKITKEERILNPNILDNYIVIQDYNIEGILITLDQKGIVYEFRNGKNTKIYNSFNKFLENEILN
ncbi:SMI1/KNR4 family protein [Clostridium tarantellae]|uniref:Knr4/Smi1-like domain-containing protein n=1 Tax=Clostridium tarantellae TaxID=39493 RepID=A0A6I1MM71_9CLOT|nr:SMI1/KNR4 family protein [Clostridium tarantellae]MPQ43548.1 hypothetical protein [Clostridium tarantellae]